jgi:hypothetical protein
LNADPGWKKFGSGINITAGTGTDPQHSTHAKSIFYQVSKTHHHKCIVTNSYMFAKDPLNTSGNKLYTTVRILVTQEARLLKKKSN